MELPAPAARDPAGRGHATSGSAEADLFTEEFLLERPILALRPARGPRPPVLLIDEIDRADDEFEALLLEFLGEASVTVPELGTFTAERPPVVVLTSNRSRDLHDALRRRCLYHWLEFPDAGAGRARSCAARCPQANEALIESADRSSSGTSARLDVDKAPGMAEAINWVAALSVLGVDRAGPRRRASRTLGALAKTPDDRDAVLGGRRRLRVRVTVDGAPGPLLPVGRPGGVRRRRSGAAAPCRRAGRRSPRWPPSPRRSALRRPRDVDALYWSARVTLVRRRRPTSPTFDAVFAAVFRDADPRVDGRRRRSGPRQAPTPTTCSAALAARRPPRRRRRRAAVAHAAARGRDRRRRRRTTARAACPSCCRARWTGLADTPFDELDDEQLAPSGAWLERRWPRWPTRREPPARVHPSGRRGRAAGRRSRASRRTGWEPLRAEPARRGVLRPRPLTLVVDVSQSMQPYAAAYLHLMRALARTGRAETFAFSTSLTRLTPALRHRSAEVAMAAGRRSRSSTGTAAPSWPPASREPARLAARATPCAAGCWSSPRTAGTATTPRAARARCWRGSGCARTGWCGSTRGRRAPGFEPLVGLDGGGPALLRRVPARPHGCARCRDASRRCCWTRLADGSAPEGDVHRRPEPAARDARRRAPSPGWRAGW